MFLHLSANHSVDREGACMACMPPACTPPGHACPPGTLISPGMHTPLPGMHTYPWARTHPVHAVNGRAVRILLECTLVSKVVQNSCVSVKALLLKHRGDKNSSYVHVMNNVYFLWNVCKIQILNTFWQVLYMQLPHEKVRPIPLLSIRQWGVCRLCTKLKF